MSACVGAPRFGRRGRGSSAPPAPPTRRRHCHSRRRRRAAGQHERRPTASAGRSSRRALWALSMRSFCSSSSTCVSCRCLRISPHRSSTMFFFDADHAGRNPPSAPITAANSRPADDRRRVDLELERHLAERLPVADARRHVVQRQRDQARRSPRRSAPGRPTRTRTSAGSTSRLNPSARSVPISRARRATAAYIVLVAAKPAPTAITIATKNPMNWSMIAGRGLRQVLRSTPLLRWPTASRRWSSSIAFLNGVDPRRRFEPHEDRVAPALLLEVAAELVQVRPDLGVGGGVAGGELADDLPRRRGRTCSVCPTRAAG